MIISSFKHINYDFRKNILYLCTYLDIGKNNTYITYNRFCVLFHVLCIVDVVHTYTVYHTYIMHMYIKYIYIYISIM